MREREAMMGQVRQGTSLIELLIASGVILGGLAILYLAFVQANRLSIRNAASTVALTVVNAQIDTDSKREPETVTVSPTDIPVPQLPNGKLRREGCFQTPTGCDPAAVPPADPFRAIRTLTYTLTWSGAGGEQRLVEEYELVKQGLNND